MAQVGNWVIENCSTIGTGPLILTGSNIGFSRFATAMVAGEVKYVVTDADGASREAGTGNFDGVSTITRTQIKATLFNGVYNDVNPGPITLTGGAIVGSTFNAFDYAELFAHLDNTLNPHSVTALQVPYNSTSDPVTSFTNLQDAMLDQSESIEQRVPSATGILAGGLMSGSGTTFTVQPGSGEIFDSHTEPGNTSIIEVTWPLQSNIVLDTQGEPAGLVNIFVASNGVVLQAPGPFALSTYRSNIFLGAIYHIAGTITDVVNAPSVVKQTASDAYDLMRVSTKISGSSVFPVDSVLSLWLESGSVFYPGSNWYVDNTNPNLKPLIQVGDNLTPIEFYTATQTGLIAGPFTVIPDTYNPAGDTITNLANDNACIHRLYNLGFNDGARVFILLYGQKGDYNNASVAKANILQDDNLTIYPDIVSDLYLLGHIGIGGNASDFTDLAKAWITSSSTGETTSGGGTTFDHSASFNRDIADQHPIASVTGGAPLASPALTGVPTAPTASVATNTTQLATTAFVLANGSSSDQNVDGGKSDSVYLPSQLIDGGDSLG